ncbi:MAG TPA: hypothetical protein VIR16_10180 [Candidatus Limnocylindrales bacterium]
MSGEALYEQYKDALKRGHVAALRGRVDQALLAYAEAARIAPERSTPHASAGNALLRRKRPAEALRHYEVALAIAPRDEAALLGRAMALAALDRRGDAADAFDTLADTRAGSGRLADAVDAARRGLEMAEGRERRRTLERLIARLRATEPDEPGRLALERALLVLEGPAVPHAEPPHKPMTASHAHWVPSSAETADAAAEPGAGADAQPAAKDGAEPSPTSSVDVDAEAAARGLDGLTDGIGIVGTERQVETERQAASTEAATAGSEADGTEPPAADAGTETVAEPQVIAPARPPRLVPPDVTVAELEARAESAVDAGATEEALEAKLDLAALHARDGRVEAALDACYGALSLDPDSVALHLALAELYTQRGWETLASEKLGLLERIARLDGDEAVVAEVAGLRAARG